MTNVRLNRKPFEGTFHNLVDDIFSELPVFIKKEFNTGDGKGFVPVNVKETDKSYQLDIIAPGFEKADFKITLEQNLLTISADTSASLSADSKSAEKYIRREYRYGSFKRSFTLDEKTDATNIDASYINGVLILNLPKREEVKVSASEIVIK